MSSSHKPPEVNDFGEADHGTLVNLTSLLDRIRQQHGHLWIVDNARSLWVNDTQLDESLRLFRNAVRACGAKFIIELATLPPGFEQSEGRDNAHLQPMIVPNHPASDNFETPSASSSTPAGQNKKQKGNNTEKSAKNLIRHCPQPECGYEGSYLSAHLRKKHNMEEGRAKDFHANAKSQCPACKTVYQKPYEAWTHYKQCNPCSLVARTPLAGTENHSAIAAALLPSPDEETINEFPQADSLGLPHPGATAQPNGSAVLPCLEEDMRDIYTSQDIPTAHSTFTIYDWNDNEVMTSQLFQY
ncbi:hypothetical protein BCR34DRAFT_634529 [Clohesyomyces aquaticus]|uniref:Uncharacterized protein n=1 Tax=Clohesyomyces aquaticus TaxID=1231657 RepID=A0A1Y2A3P1_9PLEO|nr:hypothetical protein BCR34DRAFT_634529 [Clohesyomyces aquaticus]